MASLRLGIALALASCSSGPDRPPTYHPPEHDAGPERDAGTFVPPEDPGPALPEPDLVFVLPYLGPAQSTDLEFTVEVRQLDVHFSVDTTGSFGGEIDELQASLLDVVLPGIRAGVADASLGVSRFEDFPVPPYGDVDDRPFRLLQGQTTSDRLVERGVAGLEPLGNGFDEPESSPEALYQVATGEGLFLGGGSIVAPFDGDAEGNRGGVGFRAGALPVVVQVTDARPHEDSEYHAPIDAHSMSQVERALRDLGARVVGIASGEDARPYLEHMALETGAIAEPTHGQCTTGVGGATREPHASGVCPLVYDIESGGAGLSHTIVDAVEALLQSIVFDTVSLVILDDEVGFVTETLPAEAEPPPGSPAPGLADLVPPGGDGALDSFTAVHAGTRLRFHLVLANDVVRPSDYEQIFFLRARIVADEQTILDEQTIEVVVPAREPPAPADAGADAAVPPDAAVDAG